MESVAARFVMLLLFLHAISLLLLSMPVYSDDEEDHLLQGLNSFRQSVRAPALAKHDKADCVADEIVDKLENKNCESNTGTTIQSQLMSDYPSVLEKCKVDPNTTRDGMILPVCVPHRVATLVLTNYTQAQNVRYLNDSRYTGAGIGTEDDWTVLVLTTSTTGGSFASEASRRVLTSSCCFVWSLFLVLFFVY